MVLSRDLARFGLFGEAEIWSHDSFPNLICKNLGCVITSRVCIASRSVVYAYGLWSSQESGYYSPVRAAGKTSMSSGEMSLPAEGTNGQLMSDATPQTRRMMWTPEPKQCPTESGNDSPALCSQRVLFVCVRGDVSANRPSSVQLCRPILTRAYDQFQSLLLMLSLSVCGVAL